MNQKSFYFFTSTSVLEEEINSAPVLSEFIESIQLISGNIFSLFASRNVDVLKRRTMKIETSCDIFKKKIISYCKNLDSSRVFNLIESIDDFHMQKIGHEFFFITARKFAKNQSIETFSKFLLIIFKNYEFDSHFLKGFFTANRDFNETLSLMNYMEKWENEELKTDLGEILKSTLFYGLEKFTLFCQFDDFFNLFTSKKEFLMKSEPENLRKLLLSLIQSIMYKNYSISAFKKTINFFEEQGFIFDSLSCNKILDIVNKYLRQDGFLEFTINFMEEKNLKMDMISYNIIMD